MTPLDLTSALSSSVAYLLRSAVMIADSPEAGLLIALPSHVVKVNLPEFCVSPRLGCGWTLQKLWRLIPKPRCCLLILCHKLFSASQRPSKVSTPLLELIMQIGPPGWPSRGQAEMDNMNGDFLEGRNSKRRLPKGSTRSRGLPVHFNPRSQHNSTK